MPLHAQQERKNPANQKFHQIPKKMVETDKSKRTVKVPAIYFWAAGQYLRLSGGSDDFRTSVDCLNSRTARNKFLSFSQAAKEKSFIAYLKTPKISKVIPFSRDELDLSLGALVYGAGAEFKIYSDKSFVESGFLRARKKSIEYVDCVGDIIRADSQLPEFLNSEHKQTLLSSFDELSKANTIYQTVNRNNCVLKISGFPNLFGSVKSKLTCAISLWSNPNEPNANSLGTPNRKLGFAQLQPSNDRSLKLTDVSAQTQLELTAGSLVGNWFLIESDYFKSFGKLPDITVDHDVSPVAIDALQMLKGYTLGEIPMVLSSQSITNKFSNKFPWFIPDDSTAWFKGIQQ